MNLAKLALLPALFIPLAFNPVFGEDIPADEYPTYQNGTLTIPRIDTADQSGKFQDVKLSLTEQGDWRLVDVKIPLGGPYVDTVQTVVTDTFPFQVFLKVNGFFTDGCTYLGRIAQRMKAKRFEVVMYAQNDNKPPEYSCTANAPQFEKIIPLPVYGLNAGTYEYSLGGVFVINVDKEGSSPKTFTGTFNIPRDNKL
ncbi:MAG: hypothetical protein PHP00_12635 [Thiotrichaceae bacterium]|nr:hypothetical protein [Thiotrichaceae bacterium]